MPYREESRGGLSVKSTDIGSFRRIDNAGFIQRTIIILHTTAILQSDHFPTAMVVKPRARNIIPQRGSVSRTHIGAEKLACVRIVTKNTFFLQRLNYCVEDDGSCYIILQYRDAKLVVQITTTPGCSIALGWLTNSSPSVGFFPHSPLLGRACAGKWAVPPTPPRRNAAHRVWIIFAEQSRAEQLETSVCCS